MNKSRPTGVVTGYHTNQVRGGGTTKPKNGSWSRQRHKKDGLTTHGAATAEFFGDTSLLQNGSTEITVADADQHNTHSAITCVYLNRRTHDHHSTTMTRVGIQPRITGVDMDTDNTGETGKRKNVYTRE